MAAKVVFWPLQAPAQAQINTNQTLAQIFIVDHMPWTTVALGNALEKGSGNYSL